MVAISPTTTTLTPPLPPSLAEAVRRHEERFSGAIGLWVHDLKRHETYGLRAEESFRPASTIKLFVLRELFRQAEAGLVDLDEEAVMESRDRVPGSGVIKDLRPGLRLGLRDAATLMITVSDNTATNLVIGRLGTRTINRATQEAGFTDTWLGGKLFKGRGIVSRTTPRDLGVLMAQIARRQAVSRAASGAMLDILRREQSDTIVGRFLPEDCQDSSANRTKWKVASKSGSILGHRHDVALVEGEGLRYVVALMSRDCTDERFWVDNEGLLCLAHVARAVHDHVARGA